MSHSRNILLLGSNDRASLAMCRALGQARHRVSILRLAAQRTPADHSRFCAESLHIGAPDTSVSEYLAKLTDFIRSRSYDYLVPIDDLACELTYFDYPAISSLTRVVGPNPASYLVAHNNFDALAVAESIGLARPVTQLVKRGGVPSAPLLPCFVTPVVSCAILDDEWQRFTVRKVNTVEELDAKLRDDLPRVDVMLQFPVSGTSLSVNCCSIDGDVLGASVTLRLHESPLGGGGSYQKIGNASPHLLGIIQAMARKLSWTGFMTVDCKEEQERLSFIKLTGRPCGAIALSLFAGVDFSNLILNAFEGKPRVGISLPIKTVYMRDLRKDVGWLVSEAAKADGPRVIGPWVASFGRVLMGRERFDIEQLADPLPAIRQFDRSVRAFREKVEWRLSSAFGDATGAVLATRALTKSSSLLIVCQGNINRSVVAEHLFRAQGFTQVRSAGLLAMSGRRPSIHTERFLAERLGIDISSFRSKSISRTLKQIGEVDLVLCFERRQVTELVRRFPNLGGKIFLLSRVADGGECRPDIVDPHGGSPEAYRACFQRIDELVRKLALTEVTDDRPTGVSTLGNDQRSLHEIKS
jgi:protein-tyrosine-phosphatase